MPLSILFFTTPWLLFFWQLREEFWYNPNYQFALFVPLIVAYLAYLRVESRPQANPPRQSRWVVDTLLLIGFLALWPLRLLFEANADWRLIQWIEGLLCAGLTLLALYRMGGRAYARHFLFIALLPLLAIPWPTALEKSVGTALMEGIATVSVEVVHLIGHPAQKVGNLIYLTNGTTVGVEEACSGLRSLQGNIMAAAVIGELLAMTWGARAVLFGLGIITAMLFNFIRSLILVITAATQGAQMTLLLHDSAGWSILVISFITLWGLAQILPRKKITLSKAAFPKALPLGVSLTGILLVSFTEPLVSLYYPSLPLNAQQPDLNLREAATLDLPEGSVTDDAANFRHLLFYDEGTSWRFTDNSGEWIVFFFKWDSPRLSRLGGAYHSPERCLPNTGWRTIAGPDDVELTLSADMQIPASLTRFEDAQRKATLLFAHWNLSGEKLGLDTKLSPEGRWDDFVHRQRMDKRRALQIALISTLPPQQANQKLIEFAQSALVKVQR